MDKIPGTLNALLEAVSIAVCTTGSQEQIANFVRITRELAIQYEPDMREPLFFIAGRAEHIAMQFRNAAPAQEQHSMTHQHE